MKYNSAQNDFSAGELSRYLRGRTNIDQYFQGADEMTNWLPMRQGGARLRPGFMISETVFDTSIDEGWALFEFNPRDDEAYIIALHPCNVVAKQIKIIRPRGSSPSLTKSDYIWNTRADFTNSSTAYDRTADSDPSVILDSLYVTRSGDVMIVFDGTGQLAPIVILRTAEGVFKVDSFIKPALTNSQTGLLYLNSPVAQFMRTPFTDTNFDTNLRLKPSATSGSITITAENASAVAKDFFVGDVVGSHIKITHTTTTGVAVITSKVSDSVVNATVLLNFGATTASSNFEQSAWNPRDGYPRSATFFEGRLIAGGSPKYTDTIWCSLTGNIYHMVQRRLAQDSSSDASGTNFYGSTRATDPFSFIPASEEANSIQWLHASDTLLVGTTQVEFSISGGQDSTLSFDTFFIKPISAHGSAKVQPVKIGSSLVFVSHDGRRLLEIPKRLVEYTSATELTSMSEGILDKAIDLVTDEGLSKSKNKIYRLAWQESDGVLWALVKNNAVEAATIVSMTYDKTSKVLGWAKHQTAHGKEISSICCLPDEGKGYVKRLYALIKRDGATYYSLEFMNLKNLYDTLWIGFPDNTDDTEGRQQCFLDGAHVQSDIAGSLASGDDTVIPLDTDQVNAFPNDAEYSVISSDPMSQEPNVYHGEFTPSGGNITIPDFDPTNRTFLIGVKYDNQLVTLPIEAGAQFGVAQGSLRRGHEISVYVDQSLGGQYTAKKRNEFYDLIESRLGASMDELYTGEIKLSHNADPDDTQTVIKQTGPYPLTVLWLLTKGYTYDA
jgi:hypothetical protein